MNRDYLIEQVKTIRNLCDIAILLREGERNDLLPTILELILMESQQLVENYCIIDKEV